LSHPSYEKTAHAALMKMYEEGKIRPSVNAVYPFEEAPRGLRDLANRKVTGKAVLTFPSR
jgi:NADPH:quinone reductase